MKGICLECSQPVEVIESCFNTLDIHDLAQGDRLAPCPGSGGPFDEYLEDSASTGISRVIDDESGLGGHSVPKNHGGI